MKLGGGVWPGPALLGTGGSTEVPAPCVTLGFWLLQPGCAAATSPHVLCQPSPIPGRTKHQLVSLDAPQNKRRGAPSPVQTVPGCANCARSPPKPIWASEVGPPGPPPGLPFQCWDGEQIPGWRLEQQVGDTVGWGHHGSLALGHVGRHLVTAPAACWGVMTSW